MAEENKKDDLDLTAKGAEEKEVTEESCNTENEETASKDTDEETVEDAVGQKEEKDKKDIQIEELNDRVKRQMAEFENFRKRTEKEKAGMFEMGARSVIEQLLPVIDNFERGLAGVTEETMADPFVAGVEKIYRQMTEMLTKLDVKPIEAVGKPFNPDFHNAVMHVEDEETDENVVVEEFQKGYTYKDQVVRFSMVKVAN